MARQKGRKAERQGGREAGRRTQDTRLKRGLILTSKTNFDISLTDNEALRIEIRKPMNVAVQVVTALCSLR